MPTPMTRTYDCDAFDIARLVAAKADTSVSACLPAHNEAATIGPIVDAIRAHLVVAGLVDEIVVIDDRSTDETAAVATEAGARVESSVGLLTVTGGAGGKGDALWNSVHAAEGDVIAWCDADIVNFDARFVLGLVAPLLVNPELGFVKGFYERPLVGPEGASEPGGRVTELVARPLLSLVYPHLSSILQPLGGEYAARRSVVETLPFVQGYGVDLGLLIDVTERFGMEILAQVDLGVRLHRNRPLTELGPMALAIMQTVFAKAALPMDRGLAATLTRPAMEPVELVHVERPPLVTVPAYRQRRLLAQRPQSA